MWNKVVTIKLIEGYIAHLLCYRIIAWASGRDELVQYIRMRRRRRSALQKSLQRISCIK